MYLNWKSFYFCYHVKHVAAPLAHWLYRRPFLFLADNVGKDDVRGIQLFEVYNLTATCHLMLHTGPLRLLINRV